MCDYITEQLLGHLDSGELSIGHAPEEVKAWFENKNLPICLLRLIQWHWPQKFCQIGGVNIYPASSIIEDEYVDKFISHQLLPIGYARDGGPFVIDYSLDPHPIGFLEIADYSIINPREAVLHYAARSLESFLYRISEGKYTPFDGGSANCWNIFLCEEAKYEPFPPYRKIQPEGPN